MVLYHLEITEKKQGLEHGQKQAMVANQVMVARQVTGRRGENWLAKVVLVYRGNPQVAALRENSWKTFLSDV